MQGNKLYVGNLDYSIDEEKLMELFDNYGEIISVKVIDGRGFGFIEMANSEQASNAMEELNETEFVGRTLKINEARPQEDSGNSGRGFGKGRRNNRGNRGHSTNRGNKGNRGY
ncbi:MAG: RNA-binding protein [Candidatus Dadabacteria bacterium]|nr:RNA-binding protein [Candidatus Dadabacteria bacterium]